MCFEEFGFGAHEAVDFDAGLSGEEDGEDVAAYLACGA